MDAHKEVRTVTTEAIVLVLSRGEAEELLMDLGSGIAGGSEIMDLLYEDLKRAIRSAGTTVNTGDVIRGKK